VPPCEVNSNHLSSPRARYLAEKEALSLDMVTGTGPEGRIIERDVIAELESRPFLTAAAKAVGGLPPYEGTGIGGRITINDLGSEVVDTDYTETPIKGIRKIIADRMYKSLIETAQFTLNASANVAKLQDVRAKLNIIEQKHEDHIIKITINDLILYTVSRTLPDFPYMNAHRTINTIKTFKNVHLGLAVDTPKGLMVPVIRNCNHLSLQEISHEAKRLADSCKNGTIKPHELTGSTFSISNLGNLGITSFTPLLNIPEVAILGVCGIEMKPVVCESGCGCVLEPFIGFSLTINHQAVDGAPAAKFLKALCDAVEKINV